jgi:hypothetical protein
MGIAGNTWLAALRTLVLACLALASSACRPESVQELKVINGRPVASTSPAATHVVRILVSGQTRCTGVLIERELVLFASHCLEEGEESLVSIAYPFGASPAAVKASVVQSYRSDSFAFFPLFDLTWARLSSPAPANYQPVPLLLNPERIPVGAPLLISGFGQDCPLGNCPEVLTEVESRFQGYTDQPHMPSLLTLFGQIEAGDGTTCSGDSGGPSFIKLDRRWYLVGITNGKHPIITPQAYTNGVADCQSGWTIQTFAGDYLSWLEGSSQTRLKTESPRPSRVPLLAQITTEPSKPETWSEWFRYRPLLDSGWTTVHKLLEQIFVQERNTPGINWSRLFLDATLSESLLSRLETISVLGLGLPDQEILIDDLRPLASLPGLRTLHLRDVAYKGLETLAQVKTLETLTITSSFVTRPASTSLGLDRLASASLRELRLRGLAFADIHRLRWANLPKLQVLSLTSQMGGLPASSLDLSMLPQLTDLTITDLNCDIPDWNPNPFGGLRTLTLRKSSNRITSPTCIDAQVLNSIPNVIIE